MTSSDLEAEQFQATSWRKVVSSRGRMFEACQAMAQVGYSSRKLAVDAPVRRVSGRHRSRSLV